VRMAEGYWPREIGPSRPGVTRRAPRRTSGDRRGAWRPSSASDPALASTPFSAPGLPWPSTPFSATRAGIRRALPEPGAWRLRHPAGAGRRALRGLGGLGGGLAPVVDGGDRRALQVPGQPHELALQLPDGDLTFLVAHLQVINWHVEGDPGHALLLGREQAWQPVGRALAHQNHTRLAHRPVHDVHVAIGRHRWGDGP